ncbi:hypothetical protein ACOSP7_010657 [Xanthoceras sorbifolium]
MLGNHSSLDKCSEENQYLRLEMKQTNNSSSNSTTAQVETAEAKVGQKRSRNYEKSAGGGSGGGGGEPEHEMHILTERERRKKMRNMFSSLHALLPQLPAKADKSSIVDEAVKYIKTLEQTLQTLERQKLERHQDATHVADYNEQSIITSSMVQPPLEYSREAFLADHLGPSSKNCLATMATDVLLPHPFQLPVPPTCFQTWLSPNFVVNMCGNDAQISVCSPRKPGLLAAILYILEKHNLDVVSTNVSSDRYRSMYMIHAHAGGASNQFPETLSVEETFKLAVGEMNLWLLTC